MRHLEAYAAGGDAHERGEPVQPPTSVPRQREDAWLKGWADQQAFMERQAAGKALSRGQATYPQLLHHYPGHDLGRRALGHSVACGDCSRAGYLQG
jgi:hypothetical protein